MKPVAAVGANTGEAHRKPRNRSWLRKRLSFMSRRAELPWGSGWRKNAPMVRISAGLVICLAAAVNVGCGSQPETANHSTRPGASAGPASAGPASAGPASAGPASAGSSAGCQGSASAGTREPAARTIVITLAGNATAYCARVGDKLRVDLRGTASRRWLRPLVSGDALVPIPGSVTAGAVTSASFAAVQPGRVTVTSARSPCQVPVPSGKNEPEPAFPLPTVYPLTSCPPGYRFSALVIVQR